MKAIFGFPRLILLLVTSQFLLVSCLKEEVDPNPFTFKAGDTTQIYHTYVPPVYAPPLLFFSAVDTFLIEDYQVRYERSDNYNSFSKTTLRFLNDSLSFAVNMKKAKMPGSILYYDIPFFKLFEKDDKIYFDYDWSTHANFSYSDYGMYFSYTIYNLMTPPDYVVFRIDKGGSYKYGWLKLENGITAYGIEN